MTAIVFRNLTKTYGKSHALDNLSAEIQPGRVTGLLGPNGAGNPQRCGASSASPRPPRAERVFWAADTPGSKTPRGGLESFWIRGVFIRG